MLSGVTLEAFLEKESPNSASLLPSAADILPPGTVLGHFELQDLFATGGMGNLYKALDRSTGRVVAVKVLRPEYATNQGYANLFEDEGVLLARLFHPNIIPVYYSGRDRGRLFFAMAYIEGKTALDVLEQEGPIPEERVFGWTIQLVSALATAWAHGIIHRDVKPSNVIVEEATGNAMLADFGLAKVLSFLANEVAMDWGTAEYSPPEQIRKERNLDCRTDIYSLGATLFHLLTGTTVYQADTWDEEVDGHLHKAFPYDRMARAGLSEGWIQLLARMLAKERAGRPADYEELSDLLAGLNAPPEEEAQAEGARVYPRVAQRPEWNPKLANGLFRPEMELVARHALNYTAPAADPETLRDLPAMPSLEACEWHIREICGGEEPDPAKLCDFAMVLPEYAALLQALVRGGWYEGEGETFNNALDRIGLAPARMLALICFVAFESPRVSRSFNWFPLWQHSIACGILASRLAAFLGIDAEREAMAAGFLHDIGKVAAGDQAAVGQITAMHRSIEERLPLLLCEMDSLPYTHPEVGEAWARQKKLPAFVVDVIGHHHDTLERGPHSLVMALVQVANDLCKRHGLGYSGEAVLRYPSLTDVPGFARLVEEAGRGFSMTALERDFLVHVPRLPLLEPQKDDPRLRMADESELIPWWTMD